MKVLKVQEGVNKKGMEKGREEVSNMFCAEEFHCLFNLCLLVVVAVIVVSS